MEGKESIAKDGEGEGRGETEGTGEGGHRRTPFAQRVLSYEDPSTLLSKSKKKSSSGGKRTLNRLSTPGALDAHLLSSALRSLQEGGAGGSSGGGGGGGGSTGSVQSGKGGDGESVGDSDAASEEFFPLSSGLDRRKRLSVGPFKKHVPFLLSSPLSPFFLLSLPFLSLLGFPLSHLLQKMKKSTDSSSVAATELEVARSLVFGAGGSGGTGVGSGSTGGSAGGSSSSGGGGRRNAQSRLSLNPSDFANLREVSSFFLHLLRLSSSFLPSHR